MNDPTDNHEAMQMCMDCGCSKSDHDPNDAAFPMRCNACSCAKFNGEQSSIAPVTPGLGALANGATLDEATDAVLKQAGIAPVVEIKRADPLRKFAAEAEKKHGFAPGGLVEAANAGHTKRGEILMHAAAIVDGPRNEVYGDPTANHERIAKLWTVVFGFHVTAEQVVLCMDLVKTARLIQNPRHSDSWLDKCGYSAIGGEIADTHDRNART